MSINAGFGSTEAHDPPFVAPIDAEPLARLSRSLRDRFELKLDMLPQPEE